MPKVAQISVKTVAIIEHHPEWFTDAVRERIRAEDYPECETLEDHLKKIVDLTVLSVWKHETYSANGHNYLIRLYPGYGYILVDDQDEGILGLDWSGIRLRYDAYDYKVEVLP